MVRVKFQAKMDQVESRRYFTATPYSPRIPTSFEGDAPQLTLGNRIYFPTLAPDGVRSAIGYTDGTAAGTGLYNGGFYRKYAIRFATANNRVFFTGSDANVNTEALYVLSEGGSAGSNQHNLVLTNGYNFRSIGSMATLGTKLYFVCENAGLFATDGTTAGSGRVALGGFYLSESVRWCGVIDNRLYLASYTTEGLSIYVSDGTAAGTTLLMHKPDAAFCSALMKTTGGIVFNANNQLWRTDGTPAGTQLVATLPASVSGASMKFASTGSFGVFSTGAYGAGDVWRTDGTAEGTTNCGVVLPSSSSRIFTAGDAVFLESGDGFLAQVNATDVRVDNRFSARKLVVSDDRVLFGADDGQLTYDTLGTIEIDGLSEGVKMFPETGGSMALGVLQNEAIYAGSDGLYTTPLNTPGLPSLAGRVFNDVNANGLYDAGEPAFDGYTHAYRTPSQLNRDPLAFAADKTFAIPFFPSGASVLYFDLNLNTHQHTTTPISYAYSISGGETLQPLNVGVHNRNVRTGRVRNDLNNNDAVDGNEPGVAGITVYADANSNDVLDAGEVSTTTSADGTWTIPDLLVGSYAIRVVLPQGWFNAYPYGDEISTIATIAGGMVTLSTLGISQTPPRNLVTGRIFEDVNGDGAYGASDRAINGTLWNDLNLNNVIDPGEPVSTTSSSSVSMFSTVGIQNLRVRPQFQDWSLVAGAVTFTLAPGERRLNIALPIAPDAPAGNSIGGILFRDNNLDGQRDVADGVLVGSVGLDLNNDGYIASDEPVRASDSSGRFRFNNVPAGSYGLKYIAPSIVFQFTRPAGTLTVPVIVPPGSNVEGVELGGLLLGFGHPNRLPIRATYFQDNNRNGFQDLDEPTLTNGITSIDLNGNGMADAYFGITEPFLTATPLSVAPGVYRFQGTVPTGWQLVNGTNTGSREVYVTVGGSIEFALYRPRANALLDFNIDTRQIDLNLSSALPTTYSGTGVRILGADGQSVSGVISIVSGTATRLSFRLPTTLADGSYTVEVDGTVLAASDEVPAEIPIQRFTFSFLRGDVNRDRAVNFDDLLILAQNYGQTGRTYSQGNVNYSADGKVDFDDLLILAQRYGTSLYSAAPIRGVTTKSKSRSASADLLS